MTDPAAIDLETIATTVLADKERLGMGVYSGESFAAIDVLTSQAVRLIAAVEALRKRVAELEGE